MKNYIISFICGVILTHLWIASARADFPGKINYQGKLTDPSGQLIEGKANISFSFFTDLSEGGNVWSEMHSDVRIRHGRFSVMLGSINDLKDILQANDSLWLETSLNGETLSPRQEMVSAGYAIATRGINVDSAGNIGIGIKSPSVKLEVSGEIKSVIGEMSYHLLPEGAIALWFGALAEIPSGWQLCDGNQGTPDLQNRFVYGADPGDDPGAIGGEIAHTHNFSDTISPVTSSVVGHSHTYSQFPSHSHPINPPSTLTSSDGSHSHTANPASATTSTDGNHRHSMTQQANGTVTSKVAANHQYDVNDLATNAGGSHYHTLDLGPFNSGSAGDHKHSFDIVSFNSDAFGSSSCSTASGGEHSHTLEVNTASGTTGEGDTLPPYFKLAYIMRMP
jgi:hypothetical protein